MNQFIKQAGFKDEEEFNKLVANVDISSPSKFAAYQEWRLKDGSKDGLLKLQKYGGRAINLLNVLVQKRGDDFHLLFDFTGEIHIGVKLHRGMTDKQLALALLEIANALEEKRYAKTDKNGKQG